MTKTPLVAVSIGALLVFAASGAYLLRASEDLEFVAPFAYGRPGVSSEDREEESLRHQALEIVDILHLDVLEKVAGGLEGVQEGTVVALDGPETKTLYLRSVAPVGDADRAMEFAGAGPGPTASETAPSTPASKVQSAGGFANADFRKNILAGYFGAPVHGAVSDISLTLYLQGADEIEITIFGDGGLGVFPFVARKSFPVAPSAVPTAFTFTFPAISFEVEEELVVSYMASTGGQGSTAALWYDSTLHPSAISFTLSPPGDGATLDDPAGIGFMDGKTWVLSAGTGEVLQLDGSAAPIVAASGYYAAGFLRGLADAEADANGNLFFSETDTGKIHWLRADGSRGVHAKGLGAATGIALSDAGELFVADATTGDIRKVSASGAVSLVATIPKSRLFDLAFAPDGTLTASAFRDGSLWSIDVGTGAVSQLAYLGNSSTAEGIAYDADGNLWIGSSLDNATGRLLRLAPDSTLTEIDAGVPLGGPLHLQFLPGEAALVVSSHGELGGTDGVFTMSTPVGGLALGSSAGALNADDSWQGWVHNTRRQALPESAFAGALPVGELIDVGREASEPTLGIQSDGDIFVVTGETRKTDVAFGVPEPQVMRSQDNGRTWQMVSPTLAGSTHPTATVDPFVYVDPDTDRVFKYDLLGASNYLSYSDDSGATWTTNPLASGIPPVDHQSIITGKPRASTTLGYPNVVYTCTNWLAASPCGRSLDGGDTWTPAGPAWGPEVQIGSGSSSVAGNPVTTPTACNVQGINGHLGADREGRIYLGKNVCGKPIVAVTEDDAITWKHVALNDTVGISGHDIDFAVDDANNVYAAWIASGGQIVYVVSSDGGSTWGPARFVAPPGVRTTQMPSIAAAGAGMIVVSYIGSNTDYGYAAQNGAKMAWNAYLTVSLDASSASPTLATVTAHALSDPTTRGGCARPCGGIWDFLDVRISPDDGRVWATHVDSCEGACSTDRAVPSAQFANTFMATLAAGPDLRNGGALAAR